MNGFLLCNTWVFGGGEHIFIFVDKSEGFVFKVMIFHDINVIYIYIQSSVR